jgi:hypothetical protein
MMTRIRVTLMGKVSDAVIFRTDQARNLMLATEIFMHARRRIAAHLTEETLAQFRGAKLSASKAQRNWRKAQEMLAAAGVLHCPVSGTPVMDLNTATDARRRSGMCLPPSPARSAARRMEWRRRSTAYRMPWLPLWRRDAGGDCAAVTLGRCGKLLRECQFRCSVPRFRGSVPWECGVWSSVLASPLVI